MPRSCAIMWHADIFIYSSHRWFNRECCALYWCGHRAHNAQSCGLNGWPMPDYDAKNAFDSLESLQENIQFDECKWLFGLRLATENAELIENKLRTWGVCVMCVCVCGIVSLTLLTEPNHFSASACIRMHSHNKWLCVCEPGPRISKHINGRRTTKTTNNWKFLTN